MGIDPGLNKTGIGIVDGERNKLKYISHRLITTDVKDTLPDRLKVIVNGIDEAVKEFKPAIAAIENIFFSNNVKSALLLGQTRGAIIASLILNDIKVEEFTALQIKKAVTGYGKADKEQVKKLVELHLNIDTVKKTSLDITDALACAICLSYSFVSTSLLHRCH